MKKIIVVFLFMLLMCGCKENNPPIDDPIQIDEAKVSEVYDSLDIIYEDIATIKMSDEATRNEIIRIRTLYDALNDQEKAKIRKLLSKVIKHIYFSDYTTDTFNNNINAETYHEIFKDYIAEKSNKLEVIEKKGLFSFWKKR